MGYHSLRKLVIAGAATASAAPVLQRDRARTRGVLLPAGEDVPSLFAEWRPLASLASVRDAWQRLADRALEPNVFYEPGFALSAAPIFGRDVGAVLVWSRDETPQRLVGFFPAFAAPRRYGFPFAVLVGWTHAYAPLGLPLVDRNAAEATIAAWLDCVAAEPRLPKLVLLPLLPAKGALAGALAAVLARRGGPMSQFGRHSRALLAPAGKRAGYVTAALSPKKRKELHRQRRRLDERGAVSISTVSQHDAITDALAEFMALELRGWKGQAGTAAAQEPALRHFMRQVVTRLAETGQARIERLAIGERTIAAAVTLRSGSAGWFWKIAYDEDAARASPGVQLALELTRALLADSSVAQVDSCAAPDHPMIDHLWRERLELADHLIAVGPQAPLIFPLAGALETSRRAAISAAKWSRDWLRDR